MKFSPVPSDPTHCRYVHGYRMASFKLIGYSHKLRQHPPEAELRLRTRLKHNPPEGTVFRWQYPIGHYIVDFACIDPKPVVEVDGGQHAEEERHDAARTRELESFGFRVMRFWNHEVLRNTEAVLDAIYLAVKNPTPPTLSMGGRAGLLIYTQQSCYCHHHHYHHHHYHHYHHHHHHHHYHHHHPSVAILAQAHPCGVLDAYESACTMRQWCFLSGSEVGSCPQSPGRNFNGFLMLLRSPPTLPGRLTCAIYLRVMLCRHWYFHRT